MTVLLILLIIALIVDATLSAVLLYYRVKDRSKIDRRNETITQDSDTIGLV